MSYTKVYYHIVFGTKHRHSTIVESHCEELYKYIWGIVKNKKCKLYQINGVADHVHLLLDLHPSVALADLMKDLKVASSLWMKQSGLFSDFEGWQDGYGAFTYAEKDKEMILGYIKNQKEHHKKESFLDEYKRLLSEHRIDFDDKYLP